MVELQGNFNANEHEPRRSMDPVPPGWYQMQIVESEVGRSKNNPQAQYVKLTLEFLEAAHPDLKGRKVFETLNLWNPDEKARAIATATLSSISRATGVLVFSNTDALHHKPMAVKLKIDGGDGKYDPSNRVRDYDTIAARFGPSAKPGSTTVTNPSSSVAPPRQQPVQGPSGTPPWQR